MRFNSPKIIYGLFFLSGAAGLIYEIVWSRLLVLIFGSTTNSIVAVISAFLGGLAIGSLIFGTVADRLSARGLIKLYALLESGIGITAAATLILLPAIKIIYANFSDGSSVTFSLLFVKFFLTIIVLLVPTILMGATLPVVVKFAKLQNNNLSKSVSLLYATNSLGGALGVLLAAFVLIELAGLRNTLIIAASTNLLIGFIANLMPAPAKSKPLKLQEQVVSKTLSSKTTIPIIAFSISGFISIAYEILWTRILTPTMGNFIYAFATILAIYILGLALGSLIFEKFLKVVKAKSLTFALCELAIGAFAVTSVLLTHKIAVDDAFKALLVILPSTIFMGLTFPAIISLIAKGKSEGKLVGLSYFGNTTGSIIGGFAASFFFIPNIGSSQSIVVLALFNFLIAFYFIYSEIKIGPKPKYALIFFTLFLFIGSYYLVTYKGHRLYQLTNDLHILHSKLNGDDYSFKEDEVASVFGFRSKDNKDPGLYIDGVATTSRVSETRLMAHIPLILHENPKRALVIAFGMGTTFRSSLAHNLETDAIELVPSVPKFMHFYHQDSDAVLKNPKGRVIINDGRNYAFLSSKKYDVVTIDPPPPFNAAGTSVLHSKEFYLDLSKILNPGGIVSQWIYYYSSREDDIAMAIKSFIDVFPYVLAYEKNGSVGGLFLEGSMSPLNVSKINSFLEDPVVDRDLREILNVDKNQDLSKILFLTKLGDEKSLSMVFKNSPELTDNQPKTEYFILRHAFTKSPILIGEEALSFTSKLKSAL